MKINCVLKASSRFTYDDQTYKQGDPMVIPKAVFDQFPSLFQKIEDVPDIDELEKPIEEEEPIEEDPSE